MTRQIHQLTNRDLRAFLSQGFLQITPQLPPEFHHDISARVEAELGGRPGKSIGNNLLALIPQLNDLLNDPVLSGALTGILGPGYVMHPHKAAHGNSPDYPRDPWHKEAYGGSGFKIRSHRPWWVLLFYYPQKTTAELGPTAI